MQAIIIIILVFAVLLVIFTLQNSILISLKIFFWEITDAPLVLVLISCLILGYILSAIYFYSKIWKIRKEKKQLQKANTDLKKALDRYQITVPGKNADKQNPEGFKMEDEEEENGFFKE